jgi:hypothetical protein
MLDLGIPQSMASMYLELECHKHGQPVFMYVGAGLPQIIDSSWKKTAENFCFDLGPWWSKLESGAGYCLLSIVIILVAPFFPPSASYGVVCECSMV